MAYKVPLEKTGIYKILHSLRMRFLTRRHELSNSVAESLQNFSTREDKYLEFDLGQEAYSVPLLSIREVIPQPETTPLPNGPDYFVGIMNLRGQIISIVDLRKKLRIAPKQPDGQIAVVIVEIEDISVGLIVDSINKVLNFQTTELVDVPEIKNQVNAKYIQGVFKSKDHLTILLDIRSILDINAIKKLQK